ncbi:MAG: hypothetical protein JWM11_5581 [Planctomycetaceae bacterium]|nr:hypothetical protein [Planctomycetaceae bacterium]
MPSYSVNLSVAEFVRIREILVARPKSHDFSYEDFPIRKGLTAWYSIP